jgi:hypothetical protein
MAGRFCKTRWERSRGKTYITTVPEFSWDFRKIMKHLKLKKTYLLVMILSGDIPEIMHQ